MFEEMYAKIPERLSHQRPPNGFNIEDLYTKEEWLAIGDGRARQNFGRRFASDVKQGKIFGVTRNPQSNEVGGNEARYNYDPPT